MLQQQRREQRVSEYESSAAVSVLSVYDGP